MSFVAGLLLGQLSIIITVALALRFFLFAESPGVKGISLPDGENPTVEPKLPSSLDAILEHIYYNVDNHNSESMDWFTLLVALNINALRRQATFNDHLLHTLNNLFASDHIPGFVDTIRVTELDLGRDYPLFNNCKVFRSTNPEFSDGLEARFDIDLKDRITLGIETRMLLNFPKFMFAYLPVRASVSLVNFSGRMSVAMVSTPADTEKDEEPHFTLTMSFDPEFSMEFDVKSVVGARAQLNNVPKIGQIVESSIRAKFAEQLVKPNFLKLKLPTIFRKEKEAVSNSLKASAEAAVEGTEIASGLI